MGITATYCQICQIPVNHDHYVPGENQFDIYRGAPKARSLFPFGSEHSWLLEAIGLRLSSDQTPVLLEGPVHDGWFEVSAQDANVWKGIEDRAALHRVCHEMAGRPELWSPAAPIEAPPELLEEARKSPENADIYRNLGVALKEAREDHAALRAFERADILCSTKWRS